MPDCKFVMAMNIGQKDRFEMAFKCSQEISNLNFLGAVKQSETQNLFDQALVYVHTSEREGFPNTYLQACAGKTPIVSLSIDPDSILSKYRKIDAKERKKRDLIIKLSKVVTSNQVEVDKFTMDDNSFELIVNILNSNTNIEKRAVANGFKVKKLSNGKLKIEGRL